MIANTPGNSRTERVDRRTVLRARVATFAEQRKIGDMPKGLEEGKAGVAVEPNRNNRKMNRRNGEATRRRKSLFAKENFKILCGSTTQTNIGGYCRERYEEVISYQ